MDSQIENAVQMAYAGQDQEIKRQAMQFLEQVKDSPDGWQVCLSLLSRQPPAYDVARMYSLEVVNLGVQRKIQEGDSQTLVYIRDTLLEYVRQAVFQGGNVPDPAPLQNKIVQTLTYLFLGMYGSTWTTFFDDILSLTSSDPNSGSRDNALGVKYFLRVMSNVHDEIADVLVSRSNEESRRNAEIKDVIRGRDVEKLVSSCNQILTQWKGQDDAIVESCLTVLGKWVGWIDVQLVVNETFINILFGFMGSDGSLREAAVTTLAEVVGKKMKPREKVELIRFLRVEEIVSQLTTSLESMEPDSDLADCVGKLVNSVGIDLVKILDSDDFEAKQPAEQILESMFSYFLRYFQHEYDEVCREVLPFMGELLSFFRKEKKNDVIPQQHLLMVPPILSAIVEKMKYVSDEEWANHDDETEEVEFQELRKSLKILQDHVAAIDQVTFLTSITNMVGKTFQSVKEGGQGIEWRDVELALYEMYNLGEMAVTGKNASMFSKGKATNEFGEALEGMMNALMTSNIFATVHPAIQIKYVELIVRYASFFEVHAEHIPRALEDFISAVHSNHTRVRTRSWYLFQRFIKTVRNSLQDASIIERILESISDLLVIKAQHVDAEWSAEGSDDAKDDPTFASQLSLFEAVGYLSSANCVPTEKQALYANTILGPIFQDMETYLNQAKGGDKHSIMQIHHDIMALATLARGYSDWAPGTRTNAKPPPKEVSDAFEKAAEAILVSLESLNHLPIIRDAARSSFSRLVGVLGGRILSYLPRWIEGLARTTSRSEIGMFLHLLIQVIHGFRSEISPILDQLLGPLLEKVFTALAAPTTGTDDEVQLTELRREYISFLLCIFSNDLADVLVSEANQPTLEKVIQSMEHFSRDTSDPVAQRTSLAVFTQMSIVWGPQDVSKNPNITTPSSNPSGANRPTHKPLPGFDRFMMEHFSNICWEIPADPNFKVKDAQARTVLAEIAQLQKVIYGSIGDSFLTYLRDGYFPGIGFGADQIGEYLAALTSLDVKAFKQYFQRLVATIRNAPD